MRFSVVTPVFNRKEEARRSLATIVAAIRQYGDAELVVADNGSTDGAYEMIAAEFPEAKLFRFSGTISALRNEGARRATGDVLTFIDSDCLIGADYFDHARAALESTRAEATGSMYDLPESAHWIEETWQDLNYDRREGPVHFICAGNFVVRRAAFDRVGGFTESLITGEDSDLCDKLRAAGGVIYQSRKVSAIHLRNLSSLRVYFRKQVWYGLGMFGSEGRALTDKILMLTMLHLLATVGTIAVLFVPSLGVATRIGIALLLQLLAPGIAVVYRWMRLGRIYRPARSIFLYWLYMHARLVALFRIATGQGR